MKKFFMPLAAALTLISTTAFAGKNEKINPATTTFQNEFKGATDVQWREGRSVLTASFSLNGYHVEAYFAYDGELLGTARNVLFNQLPLAIVKEVNTRFGSAPVYDIVEYNSGLETFYQMIVELPTKKLQVRATSGGEISIERKIKVK